MSLLVTFLEESCQLNITFIDNITVRFATIFPKFLEWFLCKIVIWCDQDVTCAVGLRLAWVVVSC